MPQNWTPRFAAALPYNQQLAARAEIWSGIGGSLIASLNITDGSVTEDVSNAVRRNGTITLTNDTGALIPINNTDPMMPYGNELRMFRGITYTDGTVEDFPVGVMGLSTSALQHLVTDLTITTTVADRADKVSRSKMTDYYPIAAGTDLGTAIQALIVNQVPALNSPSFFSFTPTTGVVTPAVTLAPGDDPWAQAQTLAKSGGYDLWFDQNGICTLLNTPDPKQTPLAYTYNNDVGSILEQLTRTITNQEVYNHIIVISSGTGIDPPLRADSTDNDPTSPTYINGPYGDVPTVINTTTATTQAQCQAAADSALLQALGLSTSGTFGGIVNPAHLVNDVVLLQDTAIGYLGRYAVLDAFTIPMGYGGSMAATFRLVHGR